MKNNSKISPVYILSKKIKEALVRVEASKVTEDTKNLSNDQFLAYAKQQILDLNKLLGKLDLKSEIVQSNAHYKINNQFSDVIMAEAINKSISSGKTIEQILNYIIKIGDKYLTIKLSLFNENETEFNTAKKELNLMLQSLSSGANPLGTANPIVDNKIAVRLAGKLLLQVEDRGRIWYVNPNNSQKYEVTFANALPLFEKMALGISNSNLYKIAVHPDAASAVVDSDQDGFTDQNEVKAGYNPEIASNPNQRGNDKINLDTNLANRLKGKLLLQVEDRGRIWYVDFSGKRWEVTWANLMELFKKLSLGITNADLNKIENGSL